MKRPDLSEAMHIDGILVVLHTNVHRETWCHVHEYRKYPIFSGSQGENKRPTTEKGIEMYRNLSTCNCQLSTVYELTNKQFIFLLF